MSLEDEGAGKLNIIKGHFLHPTLIAKTNCELEVLSKAAPNDGRSYCNATFDGWGCWNHTLAGETAFITCPAFITFNPNATAFRECGDDGTWKDHPLSGRPWSNYTACRQRSTKQLLQLDSSDDDRRFIYIFIGGFAFSIVMLFISLIIFFSFRQLRCERITIHKNMFISYLLTGVAWILYYTLVTLDGTVLVENPAWCKVLHVTAQYCTVSNFAWMFCEGLYLHTIMVQAFRTGKALMVVILIIGWGIPALLTVIYTAVKATRGHYNDSCWVFPDSYQWILYGPVILSVLVNICILINIIRLLVTKLRQIPEASQSKKAARATLILVPLFGLQYLVFPVRPDKDSPLYEFYHYFIALLTSLQGALVSIMYCFCNGEVTSIVRRKWHQHRLMTGHVRKNTTSATMYTEAYSVMQSSNKDLSGQKSKVASDLHNKALDSVQMKPLKIETASTTTLT
ncbi:calcitonin gene-related peptide type 1 receptor-like isoform X2 [Haliotis asinina]|uniref:calcitonin gene-related peptide type 1 receptor-like isoform X2 n=1 Tax=Haliotis asinina TaxID=109174 RepID=UPI00353239F1